MDIDCNYHQQDGMPDSCAGGWQLGSRAVAKPPAGKVVILVLFFFFSLAENLGSLTCLQHSDRKSGAVPILISVWSIFVSPNNGVAASVRDFPRAHRR